MRRPKCAVSLRWASAVEAGNWTGTHPAASLGFLGNVACFVLLASSRLQGGRSRKEELRAISLACL